MPLAVVLGACAYYLFRPPESLEDAAARIVTAVLRGDHSTLSAYTTEDEQSVTGLSKTNMARLINHVVSPCLNGFDPIGEPERITFSGGSQLLYVQTLRHSDGRRADISVHVERNGKRAQSNGMSDTLCFAAISTMASVDGKYPEGTELAKRIVLLVGEFAPQFESVGITAAIQPVESDFKAMTWLEVQKHWTALAER
ncbi:MAG: hypothetical protein KIT74_03775 [Fimbriimonadales bacterium]|nr:hypothetical protein [Fimbriimonadales bacterium]